MHYPHKIHSSIRDKVGKLTEKIAEINNWDKW